MKIISSKPKKQRFFKSVTITIQYDDKKVRIKRPFWIEPIIEAKKKPLYFNVETGEWVMKVIHLFIIQ